MNTRTAKKIVKNIMHGRPLKYSAQQIESAVSICIKKAAPEVKESMALWLQRRANQ